MIFQILIFNLNDLSLIIAAACLADSVGHHQRAALTALYQIGSAHLPDRKSVV